MKQSAKRLLSMFLALLFLAVAFMLFFDLVQPAYNTVQTSRAQLAGEIQSLNLEKNQVAQAKSLLASIEAGSASQANVALAIPNSEDLAGALAQVEGIAQNNNVGITTFGISAPTLTAKPTVQQGSSTAQAINPLGSFSVNFTGLANYQNLKVFLGQIETNLRIFDLKSITFSPAPVISPIATGKGGLSLSNASSGLLNYTISLQTYYQSQ